MNTKVAPKLTKTQLDHISKLTSKSQIIIYLNKQSVSSMDIVRLSNSTIPKLQYEDGRDIRPQHVYNVLKSSK